MVSLIKMKSKQILLIITIILLIVLGFFAYKNIQTTGKVILIQEYEAKVVEFNSSDYCEATEDTCLPASSCEFQTDLEGRKVCLGKY